MWLLRAAVFAALFAIAGPDPADAQDVTLRAQDGAVEITGTLLGFDGEFYRVDTRYGEITVDGGGVTCTGPGCPSLTDFVAEMTVSGSATIGRVLMPALIESFALLTGLTATRSALDDTQFYYDLASRQSGQRVGRFTFLVTNTDEGFADLLADEADIVMALREIRRSEQDRAIEIGLGDLLDPNRNRVLALDALIPVVAESNPVTSISLADLARAIAGEITNWSDLGGPDAAISLHLRDESSGLYEHLQDKLLTPLGLTPATEANHHASNEALDAAVSADPFGLGIANFAEIARARPLALTGPCGFVSTGTRRSIKTEDYPLVAPMFLYVPARRLPKLGRDFLAYTRSAPAQIVIRRAGFIDQAPEEIGIAMQGDRLANAIAVADGTAALAGLKRMVATLSPLRRLTPSFRFEAGGIRMDAQSRSNARQLAQALETGQYDGRRLVFVGFSDGQGDPLENMAIAQRRAEVARDAVAAELQSAHRAMPALETEAFGEAMPMACDDSVLGRHVNRRVEIWVD